MGRYSYRLREPIFHETEIHSFLKRLGANGFANRWVKTDISVLGGLIMLD